METLADKLCETCGILFHPRMAEVKRSRGRFCSPTCRHKHQSVVMSGREKTAETCRKLSESHKGKIRSKSHSANISKSLIGKLSGSNNPNWRGGQFFCPARRRHFIRKNGRYIPLARFIAEKALGRDLKRIEQIHHINHDQTDDRIENLYLFKTGSEHAQYHQLIKSGSVEPIKVSNLVKL